MSYLRVPKIYVGVTPSMKYAKIGITINESAYRLSAYSNRARGVLKGEKLQLVFEVMVDDFKYHGAIEENFGLYAFTRGVEKRLLEIVSGHVVFGEELFAINSATLTTLETFITGCRLSNPTHVLSADNSFCDALYSVVNNGADFPELKAWEVDPIEWHKVKKAKELSVSLARHFA